MRIKPSYIVLIISTVFMMLINASCKKTSTLTSGGVLKFSVDTVKFDTVFTSAGSFTYGFVIYNIQDEAITISSVAMANGATSFFHLNVDGYIANPGRSAANLKIAPHDSLYVFATVNIDPNNTTNPFFITDSLVATLNGKQFYLPFTAYGQNANYIVGDSLAPGNYNWNSPLPYVVIHTLVVGPRATLNIPADCRVYMHQDGEIIVYGTLNVNSPNPTDSVVFQGDRLDREYFGYQGYPGEWCGIWFLGNSAGNISHAVLRNCGGGTPYYNYFTQAAAMEIDTGAIVRVDHTIIENSISLGFLSFQGHLIASDCLVNTTGGQALAITQGGNDTITNCTFANYGTSLVSHANAGTVAILNYFSPDGITFYYGALNAVLQNCIVYGSLDSEIVCDASSNAGASLYMNNCLLKMGSVVESFVHLNSCMLTKDPQFNNPANGDFSLGPTSPALDAGASVPGALMTDLAGKNWYTGTIDSIAIGCYKE